MDWSTETALRSHLLFLVLFPEGISVDGSLPFAGMTTSLAVSAFLILPNKGQGTAQQVLLSIALCSEAALCNTGQCKEGDVTSAASTPPF